MRRLKKLDHLLGELRARIFEPLPDPVPLEFRRARPDERAQVVAEARGDWQDAGPDLLWGEPGGYFWFAGQALTPPEAEGRRLFLHIDAQFGSTMGRSDPQCLVRVDGRIAQGADGNHRELLLCENAVPGQRYDVLIEAGTIENRRQAGFACRLMLHDPLAEQIYYDLRVPLDVARLLPEDDPRRQFIVNRVDAALKTIDFRPGNPERFAATLQGAGTIAAEIYAAEDFSEKPTITVTGHTHIDVAWLWRIRETRQKMARSMATALALMDQYPDYRFMYNQGVLLDYLAEDYPELFDRLRGKVTSGEFEIEGTLWLEPDANSTGGESLVRHILHGVAYHEETFGIRPRILWLPDTFGYSAALPQLMKLAGIDVFVTHKLSWNDTNRMPYDTFFWQGIDGTKLASYFLTTQPYASGSIGTTYCPDLKPTHVMGTWRRYGQQALNRELFLVYGHGDGGGGPTREMLENIRRMEKGIPGCPAVVHDHMRPFFERLLARMEREADRYPVWSGELYLEFHRGTLTSVAKNKRNNRLAEQALRELEALACLAMVRCGHAYPAERLHGLWRITLLHQFHDILPGTSIGAVFDDSDRDYDTFFKEAAELKQELAAAIAGGNGLLLLNILGRPRNGLVSLEGDSARTLRYCDEAIPTQSICRSDGAIEQAAPVKDLPAMGGYVVALEDGDAATGTGGLSVSETRLENGLLAVAFDDRGRITSIFDKRNGREAVVPGEKANRLQAFRDMPPQFDAWDIDEGFEDQSWEIDRLVSARVVETGPYRAAVRFEWRYESSTIVQVISLEAESARVEVDSFIDWREQHTLVKAAFPVNVLARETTAEIQFGHVTRPKHRNTSWDQARFETVMHRWVDKSEPGFGIALLNDCKYGYDWKENALRLTLLRSPTYPWPEADQGEHRFRYGILVHHGLHEGEGVPAAAEEFNLPLRLLVAGETPDAPPRKIETFVSLEGEGVTIEAVKKAEAGDDIIIRLWETRGQQSEVVLRLPSGCERVEETDLLERSPVALSVTGGRLPLTFKPFQIRTIRIGA